MGLLEQLGFNVTKPKVTQKKEDEIPAHVKEARAKRDAANESGARATASMYSDWIPDNVFKEISTYHDFTTVLWGSRKFARLANVCRNILDVEIITDNRPLEESDRKHVLKLLMWMSLIFPIPITKYHLMKDAETEIRTWLETLLVKNNKVLTADEFSLVTEGVFSGVGTNEGNPVLDIFHDALRLEEVQFGVACPTEWMRTDVGKNTVFQNVIRRSAESNVTPKWVLYFQELKGVNNFVNVEESARDTEIKDNSHL